MVSDSGSNTFLTHTIVRDGDKSYFRGTVKRELDRTGRTLINRIYKREVSIQRKFEDSN